MENNNKENKNVNDDNNSTNKFNNSITNKKINNKVPSISLPMNRSYFQIGSSKRVKSKWIHSLDKSNNIINECGITSTNNEKRNNSISMYNLTKTEIEIETNDMKLVNKTKQISNGIIGNNISVKDDCMKYVNARYTQNNINTKNIKKTTNTNCTSSTKADKTPKTDKTTKINNISIQRKLPPLPPLPFPDVLLLKKNIKYNLGNLLAIDKEKSKKSSSITKSGKPNKTSKTSHSSKCITEVNNTHANSNKNIVSSKSNSKNSTKTVKSTVKAIRMDDVIDKMISFEKCYHTDRINNQNPQKICSNIANSK